MFKTLQNIQNKSLDHFLDKGLVDLWNIDENQVDFEDWETALKTPPTCDGSVLIPPISTRQAWKGFAYQNWMDEETEIIEIGAEQYRFADFYKKIIPFEISRAELKAAWVDNHVVWGYNLLDPEQFIYQDLESFIQFIKDSHGLLEWRTHTHLKAYIDNPQCLELSILKWKDRFPESCLPSAYNSVDKNGVVLQQVKHQEAIALEAWTKIQSAHNQFLQNGGAGGQWKAAQLQGMVWGVYQHPTARLEGQALLERRKIESVPDYVELPFSNWMGCWAERVDFSNAQLSHSLMTDANFEAANFQSADLTKCDFSRTNLKNANFQGAKLDGIDFEAADLTGANFKQTKVANCTFKGAKLNDISYG